MSLAHLSRSCFPVPGEPRVDAAALDFTEDKPSDVESETVADFSKLSLIDVAEEVVFDDVEEEVRRARKRRRPVPLAWVVVGGV